MNSTIATNAAIAPSLFQPKRLAFWLYVVLIVAGLHTVSGTLSNGFKVMPTSAVLALVAWAVYTLPLLWLIRRLGLFRSHTWQALVLAFAWGGLGAVYLALGANQAVFGILAKTLGPEFAQNWGAAIVGPSNEETLKLLGVILLVLVAPHRFRTVSSIMALGCVVGLGFQVVEDFFYTVMGSLNHPNANQTEPVTNMLMIRGFFCGLWSHAAYTAIASFGVGYFVAHQELPISRRMGVAALAFAAAWSMHAFWNSPLLHSMLSGSLALLYFPTKGLPVVLAALLLWRVARKDSALSQPAEAD